VIARAVDAASRDGGLAGVLTFDPHPIRVIAPAKAPSALLETLEHKAQVMNHLGVQLLIPLHFDQELAAMEAAEFIAKLLTANVRTIAVGEDWRFGHHRSGDVTMLQNESAIHGFRLEAVPPVMHEGERISSTRIRQAIRDGNLVSAEQMLGRPFTVTGNVVEGKKLGRTIGFPTANLRTVDAQLPPSGVWVVRARLPDGSHVGGVANIGVCPTVGGTTRSLEVHLLDFQGDLYGKNLEIQFLNYLRPEAKFPSIEALRVQIQSDTNTAREILKGK
jgi:riboflavin kinase/FMN adenylyltransferase